MLTFEEARKLYESHVMNRRPRLRKLLEYYLNDHAILKHPNRKGKNDAKVAHGYPRYISTIATGYAGSVTYQKMEDLQKLKDIFNYNSESSINSDLLLYNSIYGETFELDWLDEDGNYCFDALDPQTAMVVTDGKLRPKVTDALIFDEDDMKGNKVRVTMTVYDDTHRATYSYIRPERAFNRVKAEIAFRSFVLEEVETPHKMGRCPIIHVKNNRWCIGDFEPVMSGIDSYNLSVSNSVNDLTDFTDAYLKLINMSDTTKEQLEQSKQMRAFKVGNGGDVDWLIKNINDTYSENVKNRLKMDIHKFSFIPDMSDEQFASNASGVAIRYKLLALEQLRLEKVKWMQKALLVRLQMISDFLDVNGEAFDPVDIGITFKPNLPQNASEIVEFVSKLSGITSKSTQLEQLGEDIVPDVDSELEQIEKEKEKAVNSGFKPGDTSFLSTPKGDDDDETKNTGNILQVRDRNPGISD